MKKLIVGIFVAALAAAVLFVFLKRPPSALPDSLADQLLPEDTVAFLQINDLPLSRLRWKETALYKIAHEPEVVTFLEKPKSKIPHVGNAQDLLHKIAKIDAKEFFLAVTSVSGKMPKFISGFDYKGKNEDAVALVSELKARVKKAFPLGKADIVKFGETEIETFVSSDMIFCYAFKSRWFFVSDDLELLKSTLGRLDGKADPKTALRANADYKTALAKMPRNADALFFVQTRDFVERLVTLVSTANQNIDAQQLEEFKKTRAIAACTKLDGEKIRDAICVLRSGGGEKAPMVLNSLEFTSPQTLFYYATLFKIGSAPRLPDPSLDTTGVLQALDALRTAFKKQGLGLGDFNAAFGPEVGISIDWATGAMQPMPMLVLDIRDAAKAQSFVEALTNGTAGFRAWARQDLDGVHFYSLPQEAAGIFSITPVIALAEKAAVFGLDLDSVRKTIRRSKSNEPRLDKGASFLSAKNSLAQPSSAFGYIDSKALFENVYGIASNALKMMALFNPHASDFADVSKLPSTEAISKHLGPIVYSQSSDVDGLLVESIGPVTFNQAVFGVAVGVGVALVPTLEKELKGFNPQSFPARKSGAKSPPIPTATPTPAAH